jgi:hypothetical protein
MANKPYHLMTDAEADAEVDACKTRYKDASDWDAAQLAVSEIGGMMREYLRRGRAFASVKLDKA